MAAAAFTATLLFRGANGRPYPVRCTISDVAAAFWIFPDGQSVLQLPSDTAWSLVDAIVVTGGTDTTNSELYVNGLNTGIVLDHKSNLSSANFRSFATMPLTFKPGSNIRLTHRA